MGLGKYELSIRMPRVCRQVGGRRCDLVRAKALGLQPKFHMMLLEILRKNGPFFCCSSPPPSPTLKTRYRPPSTAYPQPAIAASSSTTFTTRSCHAQPSHNEAPHTQLAGMPRQSLPNHIEQLPAHPQGRPARADRGRTERYIHQRLPAKLDWPALVKTARSLGDTSLPDQGPDASQPLEDEALIKLLHHVLLEVRFVHHLGVRPLNTVKGWTTGILT